MERETLGDNQNREKRPHYHVENRRNSETPFTHATEINNVMDCNKCVVANFECLKSSAKGTQILNVEQYFIVKNGQ